MALLLSIIIPTFNSSGTLRNTIESILSQSLKDYEVIIVDGASSDETNKIIKEYSSIDSRITWVSEKDKGVYDAMNKGIKLAKGQYLYFLGSDDELYSPTVLDDIFSVSKSSADVIYGNVLFKKKGWIYSGESSLEKLLKEQISICHQAIFYARRVFDVVGLYNLKYFIHADYDFNVRCFENENISKEYVNIVVALYNEEGLSGTHSNADGFHDDLTSHYIKRYADCEALFFENKRLKSELRLIKASRPYRLGETLRKYYSPLQKILLARKTRK